MRLPQPMTIRGVIDQGDLEHVRHLGIHPVQAEPAPLGGKGKINPHVTRFKTADGKVTDVFHIKPVYYEAKDHTWRPMSEVASHHGNTKIVLKPRWADSMSLRFFQWLTKRQRLFPGKQLSVDTSLGFILQPEYYEYATDSTFYPDPHTETTTVDGDLNVDDVTLSGVWNTVRDKTSADHAYPTDATVNVFRTEYLGARYAIGRQVYLFDTSSIADGDTVSSATFSIYLNASGGDTTGTCSINIVTSNPASNTDLVVGDYDRATKWGSTRLCDTDLANTTSKGAYKDFTLNSTGIGVISKTSVTKLGIRTNRDLDSSAPSARSYWPSPTADTSGTTYDPKLVVTHVAGGTITKVKTFNTIANASIKTLDTIAKASLKTVNTIGS